MKSSDKNLKVTWEQVDDPDKEAVRRVFRVLLNESINPSVDNSFDASDKNRYWIKTDH